MNRISFLKQLLATLFGAALSPSLQANSSLRAQRGHLNTSVIPTEREESKRYLLSATVAGTPYYDYPEVGMGLFKQGRTLSEVEGYSESQPRRLRLRSAYPEPPEHPATLKLEPTNAFDFRAIEVYWNSHKMGYMPRRHNKVLHNLMKDGAALKAYIRLQRAQNWQDDEFISDQDFEYAHDLRIRVYLVSENDGSLLC